MRETSIETMISAAAPYKRSRLLQGYLAHKKHSPP
jgi:hypothetical protein